MNQKPSSVEFHTLQTWTNYISWLPNAHGDNDASTPCENLQTDRKA